MTDARVNLSPRRKKKGRAVNAAPKKLETSSMQHNATHTESVKPNIVEIVGRYVALRKAGKEYTGRCAFHDDKHPSFSVSEEKGLFHCFGCQESGDVIDFIMKLTGMSYREALAEL